MKENMVGWFEIPVSNMDRAKAFYEKVFNIEIAVHKFGDVVMGWFPMSQEAYGAAGTLIEHKEYVPVKKEY